MCLTHSTTQPLQLTRLTGYHHLTAMSAYLHHASRSRDILSAAAAAVEMPVESFFVAGKAYVASRDTDEADHFTWLQNFAPNLKFESVLPESWPMRLQREGSWGIRSLLIFPNDGVVSPVFFEECARALEMGQGSGRCAKKCDIFGGKNSALLPARARLVEILLGEGREGGVNVQGALLMLPGGGEQRVTVDHLVMSLGPGASLKIQPPHLRERLDELRLAGVSAAGLAVMMPSLVVRWMCNKVKFTVMICSSTSVFVGFFTDVVINIVMSSS